MGNELFQTKSNYILKAEADIFWHNCQDVTKRLKEGFFCHLKSVFGSQKKRGPVVQFVIFNKISQ